MTLLVALKGKDGLVLAADSRGTFGDPRGVTAQNDSMRKAFILTDHVALLMAGAGELGSNIVNQAIPQLGGRGDAVTPVMEAFREVARDRYKAWLPHLPPAAGQPGQQTRPELGFIIAGYDVDGDAAHSIDRIYQLSSNLDFPPMLHQYGFAIAGIPQYALYLLNRLYQADRTIEELTALGVYTITETASQDGKVGGPVRVITISPDHGCQELDNEAIKAVMVQNQERSDALRRSFYREDAGIA